MQNPARTFRLSRGSIQPKPYADGSDALRPSVNYTYLVMSFAVGVIAAIIQGGGSLLGR